MQAWGMPSGVKQYRTEGDTPAPTNNPIPTNSGSSGGNPFSFLFPGNSGNSTPQAHGGNIQGASSTPKAVNDAASAASAAKKSGKNSPDQILDLLMQYYKQKNAPLDFNDPYVRNILSNARNTTTQSANNHGIYGGYSENAGEQAYIKGAAGLQQQNSMMGLEALNSAAGLSKGLAEDQYQVDWNKYMQDKEKNNSFGELLGGAGGAILGGLAGGPAGIAGGFQLGSSFGGALAGMGSGAPRMPDYNFSGGF